MPNIGQTISQYKILAKLGEGGMGVVYKAHDTKLDRTVALKFLSGRISPSASEQTRLLNEARAAAALNHPGICSVYDILDHAGEQFIVMELVEGETLRSRMGRGQMGAGEIVDTTTRIAEALAEAHRQGIVHRDIKPENVIITHAGRVKVMDFGLARISGATRLTHDGTIMGTTAYLSPEQARGESVDNRSDIWSFGVLLYEICTGKLPFASEYDQATVYGILNEIPSSPRTLNPALPESLERVIHHCIEKLPEKRYQGMDECLSDLRAIAAVEGATGSPPSNQRKPSRVRFLLPAIAMGGVVLTIAFVFLWPHGKTAGVRSSIAVLPFKNLNNQEEDAYFAEGLTEDIISQVGTIRGLKVIGRSSVMRYKNTEIAFQEIAAELGASTLLEGSVRHVGERLRVVARLVDPATGQDLWNDTYDRDLHDILGIQSDIARRISSALQGQIVADSGSTRTTPFNLEAWRLYQTGRSAWYRRSAEGIRAAIGYFQKSVDLDPEFALAHAGLADALALLGDNGVLEVPPAEAFRNAKREALKAIALDNKLAEAHASLGHLEMHQFEWDKAERSLRRAVTLNPNSPIAQVDLGLFCSAVGKFEEARERFQNALLVDPLSIYTTSTAAAFYIRVGRPDSAVAVLIRMLRLDPSSPRLHYVLGRAYSALGLADDAIKEFHAARVTQNDPEVRVALAQAYARAGQRDAALALVDSLTSNRMREFVDPVRVAEVYLALGQKEDALSWVERAYREESAGIVFLKTEPSFAEIRSDPRFTSILLAMGVGLP